MPQAVVELFQAAAEHNRAEHHRVGNVIEFRPDERVIVSGDIHGHRQNLSKIIAYAALSASPRRMLIIQEVVHGGATDETGGDRSFELLMRVARLKAQYPEQVHLLMGNHDVAEITGNEISKDGWGVCKAFAMGLANAFGEAGEPIRLAIHEFLRSQPLAARCPNGVFISHSLPSPGRVGMFDPEILRRPYRNEDFLRGHSIYELTWGRRQDQEVIDEMATMLNAKCFINGHQPVDDGHERNHRQLVIGSETPHGVIVEFDADEPLDAESLVAHIRPIVTL